jgi:hypothetical protein
LHSDQDFQVLELPFEARLEALQAAKTLELGISAKIHDREHHDASLKDLWSRLPESLQGKLALGRRNAAKAVKRQTAAGGAYDTAVPALMLSRFSAPSAIRGRATLSRGRHG